MVWDWWRSFVVEGYPDYRLGVKLKMLKKKVKQWNKKTFSKLDIRKNNLLEELSKA